jgi:hypothetical protein
MLIVVPRGAGMHGVHDVSYPGIMEKEERVEEEVG